MKKSLCLFFASVLFLCASNPAEAQEYAEEDENPDEVISLASFIPDTIVRANLRLVQLMDLLNEYTSSSSFPSSGVSRDLKWMDNYRSKLCAYYRVTRPADNASEYEMADSVIAEARRIWENINCGTTVDLLNYNYIERLCLLFEHYNAYSRLYSTCMTSEEKELLAAEFQAWLQLEKQFAEFYRLCVSMAYWRGTLLGVVHGSGLLYIYQNHIDLYKDEYKLKSDIFSCVGREGVGTFVSPARNLLLSCCKQALIESDGFDADDTDDRYDKGYYDHGYEKLHKEAWALEPKLPQYIDNWIEKREAWKEKSICSDSDRISNNTAEVLIKLAHLVSVIQ